MRVKDLSNHLQKKFGRAIKSQGREENVGTCRTYSGVRFRVKGAGKSEGAAALGASRSTSVSRGDSR